MKSSWSLKLWYISCVGLTVWYSLIATYLPSTIVWLFTWELMLIGLRWKCIKYLKQLKFGFSIPASWFDRLQINSMILSKVLVLVVLLLVMLMLVVGFVYIDIVIGYLKGIFLCCTVFLKYAVAGMLMSVDINTSKHSNPLLLGQYYIYRSKCTNESQRIL